MGAERDRDADGAAAVFRRRQPQTDSIHPIPSLNPFLASKSTLEGLKWHPTSST
jgi:hypothetical protein